MLVGILYRPLNLFFSKQPLVGIGLHIALLGVLFMSSGLSWQVVPLAFMLILLVAEYSFLFFTKKVGVAISPYLNSRLGIVFAYMSLLFFIIFPVIKIEGIHGQYDVGSWRIIVESSNREEMLKVDDSQKRKFAMRMYYPVKKDSGKPVKWLEGGTAAIKGIEAAYGIPSFFISPVKQVEIGATNSKAVLDPGSKLPVIIIAHGVNSSPDLHARLAESLAAKGYFVAVINHTYSAYSTYFSKDVYVLGKSSPAAHLQFSNQKISTEKLVTGVQYGDIVEVIKALDGINQGRSDEAFKDRLNLSNIMVVGHQMGGGAALAALNEIPFVKAAALFNPIVEQLPKKYMLVGTTKPFAALVSEDYVASNNGPYLSAIMDNSANETVMKINKIKDLDFTDLPSISPLFWMSGLSKGEGERHKALAIQVTVIDKMVQKYIKGSSFENLSDFLEKQYPKEELLNSIR